MLLGSRLPLHYREFVWHCCESSHRCSDEINYLCYLLLPFNHLSIYCLYLLSAWITSTYLSWIWIDRTVLSVSTRWAFALYNSFNFTSHGNTSILYLLLFHTGCSQSSCDRCNVSLWFSYVSSVLFQLLLLRRWSPWCLLNFFYYIPSALFLPDILNFLDGPPAWVISTHASCAKVISRNAEKDQSADQVFFWATL